MEAHSRPWECSTGRGHLLHGELGVEYSRRILGRLPGEEGLSWAPERPRGLGNQRGGECILEVPTFVPAVCVCAHACECMCACMYVCEHTRARACVCVCACLDTGGMGLMGADMAFCDFKGPICSHDNLGERCNCTHSADEGIEAQGRGVICHKLHCGRARI